MLFLPIESTLLFQKYIFHSHCAHYPHNLLIFNSVIFHKMNLGVPRISLFHKEVKKKNTFFLNYFLLRKFTAEHHCTFASEKENKAWQKSQIEWGCSSKVEQVAINHQVMVRFHLFPPQKKSCIVGVVESIRRSPFSRGQFESDTMLNMIKDGFNSGFSSGGRASVF